MMKNKVYSFGLLLLTAFAVNSISFSQNDCATAIPIADLTGATCVSTTVSATNAMGAGSCEEGSAETWFSFVAQGSVADIVADASTISGFRPEIVLITSDDNTCSGIFSEMGCSDGTGNYNVLTATGFSGLVPGNTYWVLISSGINTVAGSLCVSVTNNPTPINDACEGAITLPLDGTCLNGTTENANDEMTGAVGCQNGAVATHPDVFYSFVADLSSVEFTVNAGTMTGNAEVVVYSGDCITGFFTHGSLCGSMPLVQSLPAFIPGSTYWVAISTDATEGTFQLCATSFTPVATPGQDCPDAQPLCNNSGFTIGTVNSGGGAITGNGSDEDLTNGSHCFGGQESQSQWYKFTVSTGGDLEFQLAPTTWDDDYDWAVYDITTSGCALNNAAPVACNWSGCNGMTGMTSNVAAYTGGTTNASDYYFGGTCIGAPGGFDNTLPASQWETPITLVAGNTYAILINNYTTTSNDGFNFTFDGTDALIGITADFAITGGGCTDFNVTVTDNIAAINSGTYTWDWGDGSPVVAGPSTNSHDYTAAGPGTYSIHIVITDNALCTKDYYLTVSVGTTIAADAGSPVTICTGASTVIGGAPSATGGDGIYSYAWVPNDGSLSSLTEANPTAAPIADVTYTLTVTDGLGCTATDDITVTIDVVTISGTLSACVGGTTTLTGSGTPDGTTPWSSATPAVATVTSGGVVTGVSAGTSDITYTNDNGCTVTETVTINANPTISGTLSACVGATTALTGSGTPDGTTPWSSATPAVATVSSGGLVTGVSAGTSDITYLNSDGCSVTETVTINANPTISGTLSACVGATTTLTGSGTPDGTTPWSSATPAVATVTSGGVVTGVSAGTSDITYLNSDGCSVTETVTISANPTFTVTGTDPTICLGTDGYFTISGLTATTSYDITYDDSGVTTGPTPIISDGAGEIVISSLDAGVYNNIIVELNSTGCSATDAVGVTLIDPGAPVVAPITGTLDVCVAATTALSNATPGGVWSSGTPANATIDASGVVTGVSAGTSVISYTVTSGCSTTQTTTVTVYANPTISGTLSACEGTTTALTGSGTPNGTTPWSSATPSVATVSSTGVVTGVSVGTSDIMYTNVGGCSVIATVTINATPTISGTLTACVGATTTLTGSGTPDATTPWSSAAPAVATVSSAGVVTGVSAGSSNITYMTNSGCTVVQSVTINANPTISGIASVCVGLTTTLTGSGTPDATTPWSSATPAVATVSSVGVVTGVSAGTSDITYLTSDGCSVTQTVTVNGTPTISGTLSACVGATTTLTGSGTPDASTPWTSATPAVATITSGGVVTGVSAGTSNITYMDNSGCIAVQAVTINANPTISGTLSACVGVSTSLTGSGTAAAVTPWSSSNTGVATVSSTGVVSGVSAGTSSITYTNNVGCSVTQTVTISANPTITGTLTVCVGATTALTGSGTAAAVTPWSSSNTGVATVSSTGVVSGVSAGTSIITYTNTNGCSTTASVTVSANPTISGNLSACVGSSTSLTGSGTPAAVNPWVSSNTGVATVSSTGVVTGVGAGSSNITYTNNNGCSAIVVVSIVANPTISGSLTVCVGSSTSLTGSGTAATVAPWTSSNTGVATISSSGVVTGVSAGSVTITYTNSVGCSSTAAVTVNSNPTISGTLTVCEGGTTVLTGSGTAAVSSPWISSNTATATVNASGLVSGISSGTSTITYTNSNGCSAIVIVTIDANPVITGILNVCVAATQTLVGSGTPDATTPWSSSNTGIATITSSGIVTGAAGGTATITYTNSNGCFETATVTVNANPTVSGFVEVCEGSEITLSGSGTPNSVSPWLSSNTAVASVSSSGVVTGLNAGSSLITYTDVNDCSVLISETVNPTPGAPLVSNDTSYCSISAPVDLQATASLGGDLTWYSDALLTDSIGTGPALTPTMIAGSASYFVTENLNGCMGLPSESILLLTLCDIEIPTAFTPDGDNTNDTWELSFIDITFPNNIVKIYNRWGTLIFESSPGMYETKEWDGTYKGESLPVASYYFIIEYNDTVSEAKTGTVSIVRK